MTAPLLSIEGLVVNYGAAPALRGITLTVKHGEAVALLGANGAGKSTLLKAIIGLLLPAKGGIAFAAHPLERMRAHRRARLGIGYCPEGRRTFPGLTVRENLSVACWGSARERAGRIAATFALFPDLGNRQAALAWQLSGGQQQMLAIGRSLMDRPKLLLLDAPTLGLSPRLTDEVLSRIPAIVASGTSVLLAEQNAAKSLQVCSRALILQLGKIVAEVAAGDHAASVNISRAFLGE